MVFGLVFINIGLSLGIEEEETALWMLRYFSSLFMMVSAFSMCCGYYERVKSGSITPKAFYHRRYARIWPFFALMVVLSLLMDRDIRSLQEAFVDLTLCFNLLPNADIKTVGIGWFIGTVFTFYMLFPFFTYLIDNKRKAWLVLAASLIFVYIGVNHKFEMGPISRQNIIYSAPFFIVGGIIYLYRDKLIEGTWKLTLVEGGMFAAALTFALAASRFPSDRLLQIMSELSACAFLTIDSFRATGDTITDRIYNNRFSRYMGKISLELYLCHMLIFRVISQLPLEIPLERYFEEEDVKGIVYLITLTLTLAGAIIFSHYVKFYIFPYIGSKIELLSLRKNKARKE